MTRLLLLIACAVVALAGAAQAQPSIDTNNDGKLSLPEFLAGRSAPMMARLDTNKDGKITQAEMAAMRGNGPPPGAPAGKGPGGPGRPAGQRGGGMAAMDANKDGVITRAELDAMMTKRFRDADADHNGSLSLAEFQGMRGPGGGGGPPR